jgi:tetratricopeptide (TPR) repeat protein
MVVMRHRPASVIFLVAACALSANAFADGNDKYDPENRTHISKFMETVVEGNAKLVSRDFPAAIEVYRRAIQLQPMNPLGHYMLGQAQSAAGNSSEAEASYMQADSVGDKAPSVKVKALFCLADLKERQKKWEEAKTAWERYKQFIAEHAGAGGAPASADARILAIDTAMKQDKAYDVVRQRIAAEAKAAKK